MKSDGGSQIMVICTITELHCFVISLFCNLVRPLFQFIFVELSFVTALFTLFHKH